MQVKFKGTQVAGCGYALKNGKCSVIYNLHYNTKVKGADLIEGFKVYIAGGRRIFLVRHFFNEEIFATSKT